MSNATHVDQSNRADNEGLANGRAAIAVGILLWNTRMVSMITRLYELELT